MSNQASVPPGNPAPNQNHPSLALEAELDALLGDREFLYLQHREDRPNLFRILGTSFTERWHSAFLKWLLDPSSHHGLGDFPMKRFLASVLTHGIRPEGHEPYAPKLTLADIEQTDMSRMKWKAEFSIGKAPSAAGPARVDLYGSITDSSDGPSVLKPTMQIVIENKVNSQEQPGQTTTYFEWANAQKYSISIYIFLTRDGASPPEHPAFIQVYYPEFYDRVLLPVLHHPKLSTDARFLVEQYMANLTDTTQEQPMAQGDKDLCVSLYDRYQKVFDAVFRAKKEAVPAPKSGRTPQKFTVSLQDLVDANLIGIGQRLMGHNKKDVWEADLIEENASLLIRSADDLAKKSPNPSRTASDLVGRPMNGWVFWKVKGGPANQKTLADLRDDFLNQSDIGPDLS